MKLEYLVEAILFCTDEPVLISKLMQVLDVTREQISEAIYLLDKFYEERGIYIQRVAGGLCLATKPEYGKVIERAFAKKIPVTLSKGAIETLAIIAYCQPVTRRDIQSIRNVNPEASLNTLIEKGLVQELGRKDSLGRPILYGTTAEFLKKTSLNSLSDLPQIKSLPLKPKQAELED